MPAANRLNPLPVDDRYAGIYSHGVVSRHRRTLYVSGQIGFAEDGSLPAGFADQCRNAIDRVIAVVRDAGLRRRDIVKTGFFLVRRSDMSELVRVRQSMLDGVSPAVTTVLVAGLVEREWLVEVEAIAAER